MHKLHFLDIAIIVLYLIGCLAIGFFSAKKITNIREYALGGKYIPTVVLVGTILATQIGAGDIIGITEKVYSLGIIVFIVICLKPICWIISAKIFANNISYFKDKRCLTIGDIMEVLYGRFASSVTNLISIISSIVVLIMQITAMGYLFNYFLGVSPAISSLIGFSVLITYSFFGGARSIVLTDVFQAITFFIGIPLATYFAYNKAGGIYNIISNLPSSHTTLEYSWGNLIMLITWLFYYGSPRTDGVFIQRYLMASSKDQLVSSLKTSLFLYFPFIILVSSMGYIIKSTNIDINPNLVFFHLATEYLPIGVLGFLITGILAAIMSTADSWLNTASVAVAHDIIKKLFPKITSIQEVFIAKISVLIISALAAFLALSSNQGILNIGYLAGVFWEPIVSIPLIIGLLKFKTNHNSFLGSCIGATTCMLLGRYFSGEFGIITIEISMLGSALGLFITHYIQKRMGLIQKEEKVAYVYSNSIESSQSFFSRIQDFSLKKLSNFLIDTSNREVEENGKLYFLAGMICFIYFILNIFFWSTILNSMMDISIIILKSIGAFLCIGFFIHEYADKNNFSKYFPLYYYITLTWMLPTFTIYMIYLYGVDSIWVIDLIFVILGLYALTGRKVMPILMIIGSILGCIFGAIRLRYEGILIPYPNTFISTIYSILLTGMLFLMIKVKDETLHAIISEAERGGNTIAHGVRQPMSYVYMCADILINTFSKYPSEANANSRMHNYSIARNDFDTVKSLSYGLKDVAEKGNKLISTILTMSRSDMDKAEDMGQYDIREIVEEAADLYLRTPSKANRISLDLRDSFIVRGSKHFLVHAIENIIDNSMKYAGTNAILKIWCEDGKLYFRDNGRGVEQDKLQEIFNKHKHMDGKLGSTGLGMHFCKKVVEAYGGTIKASSVKGEYMEFVLTFSS